jgi:hypothetical protein
LNQSGYEATGCLNANDAYDAMYEAMMPASSAWVMLLSLIKSWMRCRVSPGSQVCAICFSPLYSID